MNKDKMRKIQESQKIEDEYEEIIIENPHDILPLSSGGAPINLIEILEKMDDRKIFLFEDINKKSILNIINQIYLLERRNDEDIELIINSDGGFVADCIALIDVMNASKCDFKTVVLGVAASAACLIAANGTPGKRWAGRNAEFMFHEAYETVAEIRSSDLRYIVKETQRTQQKINRIFSKCTGRSIAEISEIFYGTSRDTYMNAEEARKFGMVDKILRVKRRENNKDE